MEISDVRVKLMDNASDRLKAVCSITFDGEFVVRDMKVVDGTNGLFVAMPSRKLAVHCPQCRHKNHLRARFCNDCGAKLPPNRVAADPNGRVRLHRDIAHPINPAFRELVQAKIIERYTAERELAGQPGYQPTDLDAELDEIADSHEVEATPAVASELTEYDALIAGLRSGSDSPPAPSESPSSSPRAQTPAPRAPRPGPAPRRSDSDGGRRPARSSNGGRGERPSSAPARQPDRRPAPAPAAEGDWRPPADEEIDDPQPTIPAREAPVADARPAPSKPAVERDSRRTEQNAPPRSAPPPAQAPDDDQPFGAGIV